MKFLAVVLSTLMLVACGGGGGGATSPTPTPESTSTPTSASASIGSAGGTVQTSNRAILVDIPPNALSTTQEISISTALIDTPPGNVGDVFFTLGPDGTTFGKAVKIQVRYDPLSLSPSMAESDLSLAYADANQWNNIPTVVDAVNKTLTAELTHFSTYAVTLAASTKEPWGKFLGYVRDTNVAVYSNAFLDKPTADCQNKDSYNVDNAGGYNTGCRWQCVELVNRYFLQQYGLRIRVVTENANQYYKNASARGLLRYPNRGADGPLVGDILVSENSVGHVAVVTKVTGSEVYYAQQNFTQGQADLESSTKLTQKNGIFDLGGFNSTYPIVGWVRSPTSKPLAEYVSQGGLTWMPVTFSMNFADANTYCEKTAINGQNGWRMAEHAELISLDKSGAMKDKGWKLGDTWSSTLPYQSYLNYLYTQGVPVGSPIHVGVILGSGSGDLSWNYDSSKKPLVSCVR